MKHASAPVKKDSGNRQQLVDLGLAQAHLAHELRNIFVTIGLSARSLQERVKLDATGNRSLQNIVELAASGEALLRSCLDLVAPMKGAKEPVNVVSLLKRLRRTLAPRAAQAGVAIRLDWVSEHPCLVSCVRRPLRRALLNVAQNGIEAMAETGGTLTLGCHTTTDKAIITFKDTGPGMEPEVVRKAFNLFFSSKKGGTGLGLALAKKVIQDHNGRISTRSRPNKGTTMTVQLPRLKREPASDKTARPADGQ